MKSLLQTVWVLLLLPLFFLLNGVNENLGLVTALDFGSLLLKYTLITIGTGAFCWALLKSFHKSIIAGFVMLAVFFFFGALKDWIEQYETFRVVVRYSIFLPVMAVLVVALFIYLAKSKKTFVKPARFLVYFLFFLSGLSLFTFMYRFAGDYESGLDFGDADNSTTAKLTYTRPGADPSVYWLVFDMYPSSASLKLNWNFDNPLDSLLIKRGFYIAPNATSNYNYTHYSMASTLDMCYLPEFFSDSIVAARDQVRGNYSLRRNNVVRLLESRGYAIENYTIYDLENHPTRHFPQFNEVSRALIDHQTLYSRVMKDIAWHIYPGRDSATNAVFNRNISFYYHTIHQSGIRKAMEGLNAAKDSAHPVFYMLHLTIPHEPYIYSEQGKVVPRGLNSAKEDFLPQLKYTNTVILKLVDSILSKNKGRDISIIVQGDHGYRYNETDKEFDSESCKILYAVYNSAGDYEGWYDSMSSVNGFRILFNQRFKTNFPLQKDTSFILHYR